VTEFGTCAYQGAGERGGFAWIPPEGAVYDEQEQVRYFTELLDVFEREGIDTALWFTFAGFALPSRAGSAVLRRRPDAGRDALGAQGGLRRNGREARRLVAAA
jgi:hypothetical protein